MYDVLFLIGIVISTWTIISMVERFIIKRTNKGEVNEYKNVVERHLKRKKFTLNNEFRYLNKTIKSKEKEIDSLCARKTMLDEIIRYTHNKEAKNTHDQLVALISKSKEELEPLELERDKIADHLKTIDETLTIEAP